MAGLISLICFGCAPVYNEPGSTITIYVTGATANSVDLSWVVHSHSESRTLQLSHGPSAPWTVSYSDITPEVFDNVYLTVRNTGGNTVLDTGDGISLMGSSGTNKNLQLTVGGVPADLSAISVNDILEDNSGNLFFINTVQNTSAPHTLVIKDSNNNLDLGSWRILQSNYAYFSVWIERDGLVVGSPTVYATLIGDVDFSYGSASW